MPIYYKTNCKICIACKNDPVIMRGIYQTKAFIPHGETLTSFARRHDLQYAALTKHVKRHQTLEDRDLGRRQMTKLHHAGIRSLVTAVTTSENARQAVLDMLYTKIIEKGDLSIGRSKDDDITMKDAMALVLTASKNTDDVKAKAKDQEIDIVKQMQGIRSGGVLTEVVEGENYDAEEGETAGETGDETEDGA